jgi:hypothetical protein
VASKRTQFAYGGPNSEAIYVDTSEVIALSRVMRKVDRTAPAHITAAMKEASQPVAAAARSKAESLPIPKGIAGSIRGGANRRFAFVQAGGSKASAAASAFEFGGRHPFWGHWSKKDGKPFHSTGLGHKVPKRSYLQPAVRENLETFAQEAVDALARAIENGG